MPCPQNNLITYIFSSDSYFPVALVDYFGSRPIKVEQDSSSEAGSSDRGREAASRRTKKGYGGFYNPRYEDCSLSCQIHLFQLKFPKNIFMSVKPLYLTNHGVKLL